MTKIKVLHHSNQLGYGGTEKTMQLFCKYLDKERFEVHALTLRHPVPPHRVWLDATKGWLGNEEAKKRKDDYRGLSARVPQFEKLLGKERVHFFTNSSLPGIIKNIGPHILHVHHSGISEPPLDQVNAISNIPLIVTTNVFGYQGTSPHQEKIDRIMFISSWLKEVAALWSAGDSRCSVLYYPVEKPHTQENLRGELEISDDIFVIGRIGRSADDIHDPISLRAYKEIENNRTLFLALSPSAAMKKDAANLGIKNIRYLDATVDDHYLSRFYNTIDVFAHARLDGETFGCVIAEAMIHGKPVVTHRSDIRNAQIELVGDSAGFVVDQHDWKTYGQRLAQLMSDNNLKLKMGEAARKRAVDNFEASGVTKKLEKLYIEELSKKNVRGISNEVAARNEFH